MADPSTDISATALAIALVALVISVFQFLQQYISTAEGYRRCEESVIGLWNKFVKWHFHLRELRYEITYQSPHITIGLPEQGCYDASLRDCHPDFSFTPPLEDGLMSTVRAAKWGFNPTYPHVVSQVLAAAEDAKKHWWSGFWNTKPKKLTNEDRACWIYLLEELRELEAKTRENGHFPNVRQHLAQQQDLCWAHSGYAPICLEIKTWSWDFMPPELVRPMASSALKDVIIWCHRLGMKWQKPPSPSTLQAEGNGYSLSATTVRGLGTVASFIRDRGRIGSRDMRWAPTRGADTLAFGILPVHSKLGVPEIEERHLVDRFREWDKSEKKDHYEAFKRDEKEGRVRSGLSDFLALVAPIVTDIHFPIFRIPRRGMFQGGIDHLEEWQCFQHELDLFLKKADGDSDPEKNQTPDQIERQSRYPHLRWARSEMERLGRFGSYIIAGRATAQLHEVEKRFQLERIHELCCAFAQQFNEMSFRSRRQGQAPPASNYYELLQVYCTQGIHRRAEVRKIEEECRNAKRELPWKTFGAWPDSTLFCGIMHLNWARLSDYVHALESRGFQAQEVQDPHGRGDWKPKPTEEGGHALHDAVVQMVPLMMLKAMIWYRTVELVGGQPVIDPTYRNSNIPIYIG